MALSTQELQSETGGIDGQTYSPFRESSSVALQTSTDLKRLKVVTMVRRLAAQEHSVAHVQLASRISAVMKFGVGADDDSAASSRSGGPVSVSITETGSVHEPHNARRLNCGGCFDQLTDDNKSLPRCSEQCLAAQVDRSGQEHVSDLSYSACTLK